MKGVVRFNHEKKSLSSYLYISNSITLTITGTFRNMKDSDGNVIRKTIPIIRSRS